ncbi:Pleckstrin -like proteiny domain-containing family A member 7 [Triplophysa tibetana]|uniref:Pleckstrin-like proteiny domain-containing family A member 7 n=1 Tax=Triplophysa tibetana TaxID=1572043 RepID=A0A5A9P1I1_9TELE|nr:Pleckstrin -like proteiny domain-containing family A member 7 [Triplophysa tibetana]
MAAPLQRDTLPESWSYGVCRDGRVVCFHASDESSATTWLHPRTGEPVNSGHMIRSGQSMWWRDKGRIERQMRRLANGMLCDSRRHWLSEPPVPLQQTLALASECGIRSCVLPWQTLERQRQRGGEAGQGL